MLEKLSSGMRRFSTGWVALLGLVVFVVFTITVLPAQSAQAERSTGGANVPDLSFYYSAEQLYGMAESYGAEGRDEYIRARFTFDLVWPLVYTLFLATAISWVFGKAFAPDSPWQRANLAPLLGALFDYLENLSTSLVMLRYPAQTPVVDALASVFTALKWGFLGASFVLLFGGVAVAAWRWTERRVRGRRSRGRGPGSRGGC